MAIFLWRNTSRAMSRERCSLTEFRTRLPANDTVDYGSSERTNERTTERQHSPEEAARRWMLLFNEALLVIGHQTNVELTKRLGVFPSPPHHFRDHQLRIRSVIPAMRYSRYKDRNRMSTNSVKWRERIDSRQLVSVPPGACTGTSLL